MIALIQRVCDASVRVDDRVIGSIGPGILALIGVRPTDTPVSAARLAERVLGYRVFADASGRMNRSVVESAGALLLVPQFTLAADTRAGLRPGFSSAAAPELASTLFNVFVASARERCPAVETGEFGASMQVTSTNDGPVTFWLES